MPKQKKRSKAEASITLTSSELLDNNVDGVRTFLMHIDLLLQQADEHLGKLQPPHGRIRIEWWKCPQSWADGSKCPVLVRWHLSENRTWQAKRISVSHLVSRAKRNGWFRESYEQVREVLESVSKLMALRKKTTTIISRYLMTIQALRQGNMEMMMKTEADLEAMDEWVAFNAETLSWAKQYPAPQAEPRMADTPKAETQQPLPGG